VRILLGLGTVLLLLGSGLRGEPAPAAAERTVPLSPRWEAYARAPTISFAVRECGIFEPLSGFRSGDLAEAARAAASAWASLGLRIPLSVEVGTCGEELPRFGNRRNEIYWTGRPRPSGEFGDCAVEYTSDSRIQEQDIRIDPFRLSRAVQALGADKDAVLYNALVHELGHALGLGDAYEADPAGCGWSVMLKLCSSGRLVPTPLDREALARIYGEASLPRSRRGSGLPNPNALVELDTNGNGRLDDPEVFRAVDLWVRGELPDAVLFDAIEAWIAGKSLHSLRLRAPMGAQWVSLALYDLRGRRVGGTRGCVPLAGRGAIQRGISTLLTRKGLPAGVYLAQIRDCYTGAVSRIPILLEGL